MADVQLMFRHSDLHVHYIFLLHLFDMVLKCMAMKHRS
jgi:hypothetical protein